MANVPWMFLHGDEASCSYRKVDCKSTCVVVFFAALLLPSRAEGATRCSMRVIANGVDSAWITAARDVAQHFRNTSEPSRCASIELRAANDSTELVLTRADGRRAVRQLDEPFELAPTVEAMLVSFDWASPSPPAGASSDSDDSVVVTEERSSTEEPPPSPKRANVIVIGGAVGARMGGQLATPVVGAFGALRSGAWEIGVVGQWESSYESVGANAARPWSAAGFAAGVILGRRQTLSPALDLRAGISLAGAVLHEETHHQRPEQWLTRADGRLGAYAGAVLPLYGAVRFRAEVAIDFVPPTGQTQAASPDVPSLPNWAGSLTIGAETNGP